MILVRPLPSWYTFWSLSKTMHFSMYKFLSLTTIATPLSAVGTKQLLSFCRLCKASLSCLVMLDVGTLESRVKEDSMSSTSAIFQHSTTCNHPNADISQFKILHQDTALNHNTGKMNILKIFNQILNTDNNKHRGFYKL